MEKKCTKCNVIKSIDNYSRYKKGYKPSCKTCYSIIEKNRRIVNGGVNRIDRSSETESTKICTKCLILKSKSDFKNNSWCTCCIKELNRKHADLKEIKPKFVPIIIGDSKQCNTCKEIKLLTEYSDSERGRLDKTSCCKPCQTYLAINKYTTKVKLVSDNTVTPEFIFSVYSLTHCYYCNKEISKDDRSLEHLQPLSKGGFHSTVNITMACKICNCTKRDMTEKKFINYLNKQKDE